MECENVACNWTTGHTMYCCISLKMLGGASSGCLRCDGRAGEFHKNGYKVLYSGRSDKSHKEGVALVLQKEASKALIRYEAAGFMILKAKFLLESNNHTAVCPNITINRRGDRRILHRSKLSESGLDDSYMGF